MVSGTGETPPYYDNYDLILLIMGQTHSAMFTAEKS